MIDLFSNWCRREAFVTILSRISLTKLFTIDMALENTPVFVLFVLLECFPISISWQSVLICRRRWIGFAMKSIYNMDNVSTESMCTSCPSGTCTNMIKNTECPICLETIPETMRRTKVNQTQDITINIYCCHGVHSACLRSWRNRLRVCPYCRSKWMSVDEV